MTAKSVEHSARPRSVILLGHRFTGLIVVKLNRQVELTDTEKSSLIFFDGCFTQLLIRHLFRS